MAVAKKTTSTKNSDTHQIPFYDMEGKAGTALSIDAVVEKVNTPLLAQYVHVYRTNQRQGNASTKSRGEIVGSTKKIYRQKGTGGARHGSRKAPIFVGGGVAFGPRPRTFSLSLSKNQRKAAFLSAFSLQYKNGNILSIEDKVLELQAKTKELVKILKSMELNVEKTAVLVVVPTEGSTNFTLAARNLGKVDVVTTDTLNTYDLLKYGKILFVQKALNTVQERFQK